MMGAYHSKNTPTPNSEALLSEYDMDEDAFTKAMDLQYTRNNSRRGTRRAIKILSTAMIALLATWGAIDLTMQIYHRATPARSLNPPTVSLPNDYFCGDTPEEAIARGCEYDYMLPGFVHTDYIDAEVTEAFLSIGPDNGNWRYYDDANGTSTISPEILPSLWKIKRFHGTHEWHVMHCVYLWWKEFRSFTRQKSKLNMVSSEEHILHCARFIQRRTDFDSIDSSFLGKEG
ncbi:hypothetical protein ACN47E_002192 [Coniothyrium glycines]